MRRRRPARHERLSALSRLLLVRGRIPPQADDQHGFRRQRRQRPLRRRARRPGVNFIKLCNSILRTLFPYFRRMDIISVFMFHGDYSHIFVLRTLFLYFRI